MAGSLGYDNADRLTSVAYTGGGASLESVAYTRNAAGDPTQLTDSSGTTTYGYDAVDRLTSASYPNNDAVSYAYDPVGNRTSLTVNGVQTTSSYDAADRLTASGAMTYTYDANGNQLTKTAGGVTTTYSYDLLNRLTAISGPVSASYTYDGDGLRVGKTVGTTTTSYAWDPTGLGTVLSDGNEYVWGQGLVSQVSASGTTYAQADGLGSIRLLTDGSGNVVGRQSYDAYGAARSQSGVQLPFGFTGEQTDAESGLVYLRARYLDPTTGRFLSRDSFGGVGGDPQSLNRYAYTTNQPTAAVDPTGRRTYYIGGISGNGNPAQLPPRAFWQSLAGDETHHGLLDDVRLAPAYGACFTPWGQIGDFASLLGRDFTGNQFGWDTDAATLAARVQEDLRESPLRCGEQLNFIGYSGGATVALDTARLLQGKNVHIDNIVTIGAFEIRGKPGNVGTWTALVGGWDMLSSEGGYAPDHTWMVPRAFHKDLGPIPGYFSNGGEATLRLIQRAGLH